MLFKGIKNTVRSGLGRAYRHIQVHPGEYLQRIRRTYGLPIHSFQDMFFVPEKTVEYVAEQTVSASVKIAVEFPPGPSWLSPFPKRILWCSTRAEEL